SGDTTYSQSVGQLQLEIRPNNTTTTLVSSGNPSLPGSRVRFTATVSPPVATGSVGFYVDGVFDASVGVNAGVAALTISDLATGVHDVWATYSGAPGWTASSSAALLQQVSSDPGPYLRVL